MAISTLDLSGNTFTLTPMNMTDKAQTLLESIISNIQFDKQKFEDASGQTQDKLNELINSYNLHEQGTSIDFDELQNNVNAIIALQSEAGDQSFVGLFTKLFNELNRRQETLAWTLPVTATVAGRVGIDLSAYNFNSTNDYEVQAEVRTTGTKNLTCSFEKVSATQGYVTIRDSDYVSFGTNENSFFTADNVDNAVDITIILVRTAVPLFATVTEVDGDVDEFGTPLYLPVAMVTSSVDAAGIYSFNGTQGTEANTVLTVLSSDNIVVFNSDAVSGTDAFNVVSATPVKVNGSITIQKTVDGVSAPSATFNYVSPFPQITSAMLTVDETTGDLTFTSSDVLANSTLSITGDNGVLVFADIVLDANGIGTTTENNAVIKDGSTHTLLFTVTRNSLTSAESTKTITIVISGNLNEI